MHAFNLTRCLSLVIRMLLVTVNLLFNFSLSLLIKISIFLLFFTETRIVSASKWWWFLLLISDLFNRIIVSLFIKSLMFLSISFEVLSIIIIFKSASFDFSKASKIPFFSTSFLASLMPAVSASITGYPSIFRKVSITSLVVPSSSETMATSLLDNKFSKDDLPAFTSPIIDTLKPFLIFSPILLSSKIFCISW